MATQRHDPPAYGWWPLVAAAVVLVAASVVLHRPDRGRPQPTPGEPRWDGPHDR